MLRFNKYNVEYKCSTFYTFSETNKTVFIMCKSGNILFDWKSKLVCEIKNLSPIGRNHGVLLRNSSNIMYCQDKCFTWDGSVWSGVKYLDHEWRGAGAFKLVSDRVWIIGGAIDKRLSVVYANGSFQELRDLDHELSHICTVQVNSTLGLICKAHFLVFQKCFVHNVVPMISASDETKGSRYTLNILQKTSFCIETPML